MSLPETFTMADFSGKFTLNKTLTDSDAADQILAGQGIGFLKRKALGAVSQTMHLKHYKDANGVECVEIQHHLPQGHSSPPDTRRMTWVEEEVDSKIFGKVSTKTRRVALADLQGDVEDAHLTTGWTFNSSLIQSDLHADTWSSVQIWGIEDVGGERRHTRHVKFTGPKGGVVHCRFVYDYLGSL